MEEGCGPATETGGGGVTRRTAAPVCLTGFCPLDFIGFYRLLSGILVHILLRSAYIEESEGLLERIMETLVV